MILKSSYNIKDANPNFVNDNIKDSIKVVIKNNSKNNIKNVVFDYII